MPDFSHIQKLLTNNRLDLIYKDLEKERREYTITCKPPVFVPSHKELKTFILNFIELVMAEKDGKGVYTKKPGLLPARIDALHQIWDVITGLTPPTSILIGIDPYRYLFLLAMRIRRPRVIDQGSMGFCGPATILTDLAKRDPCTYTKFAIDLLLSGKATWKSLIVSLEPGNAQDWQKRKIQQLEYVTMLALRKQAEIILSGSTSGGINFDLDNQDSHATTPSQMKILLEQAGYDPVRDLTVSSGTFSQQRTKLELENNERQLKTCSTQLTSGNIVIMLVHPDVARNAKYSRLNWSNPTVKALHELHWINVKSLSINPPNVTLKIVTWRWSGTVTFPLDKFLPRYFGYIEAKP
jgi:hypothetical protein